METRCIRGCCVSSQIKLNVSTSEIRLEDGHIAQSGASVVRKGTYQGQQVAVKLPSLPTTRDMDRFHQELSAHLALHHDNLTPLLGALAHPPKYALIMPLAKGTLLDLIYDTQLILKDIVCMFIQIARGLQALHEKGYVHRDIKPANILLFADKHVKITDFQLVQREEELYNQYNKSEERVKRGKPTGGFHKQLMVGTLQYMAPEILSKTGHSKKADVYSFAVTINEALTKIFPFSDCSKERPGCHTVLEMGYGHQELKAAVVSEGLRPSLSDDAPPALNRLIERCWSLHPEERPTFTDVCEDLLEIHAMLDSNVIMQPISNKSRILKETHAASDHSDKTSASEASSGGILNGHFFAGKKLDLNVGKFQSIGNRESQEDRLLYCHPVSSMDSAYLFGVFDGHRGCEAAQYCNENLERTLLRFSQELHCPKSILEHTFHTLDVGFRESHPGSNAGATALVVLLCGLKVTVANCGDCRCIVGGRRGVFQLSKDHTTTDEMERERIIRSGGKISFQFDTWRIGTVGLQVTRSIGDADVKKAGVISTPEITEYTIEEGDEFLLLASDGLWDTLSNEEVLGLINDTVKNPSMSAQRLVMEAATRGSTDNTSIVLSFLSQFATHEKIFADDTQKYAFTQTFYASR